MGEYSKIGYFPTKVTKENSRYTNLVLQIAQKWNKEYRFSELSDAMKDMEIIQNLKEITALYSNVLEDKMNYFHTGKRSYLPEEQAMKKLMFISTNYKELFKLICKIKYIKYNGSYYLRNSIVNTYTQEYESVNEVYYKYNSPKFLGVLFTDDEFKSQFIKIDARTLIERYNALKDKMNFDFDEYTLKLFKNIQYDLDNGIEGAIFYDHIEFDEELIPSKIRKKYIN